MEGRRQQPSPGRSSRGQGGHSDQGCSCFKGLLDPGFHSFIFAEVSGTNLTSPCNVTPIIKASGLKSLQAKLCFTQSRRFFLKAFLPYVLLSFSQNCPVSFLSRTPSRNIIPCSVHADQIPGGREGARLGHGQSTTIQTPALTPAGQGRGVCCCRICNWGHSHTEVLASGRWTVPSVCSGRRTTHCQPGSSSRRDPR